MSSELDLLLKQPSVPTQLLLNIKSSCTSKHLCLSSNAAILIILWAAVVGTAYSFCKDIVAVSILTGRYAHIMDVAILDTIPYATLMIIMIFYPLSGFFADVYCGRFKITMISLSMVLLSFVLLGTACFWGFDLVESNRHFHINNPKDGETIVVVIVLFLALAIFIIGLCGYHANYIQLGLDQLLEAPNEQLGLFVHYATWAFTFSSMLDVPLLNLGACYSIRKKEVLSVSIIIPSSLVLISLVLFIITCWKRHKWFFAEPGHNNPYKIVYKVLKFAKKHKYPLRRSAFTYCDDYIPTRIDFAKQRYGGPFTTEQVEDVKTLMRILTLLFAMGPVFVLQLPASQYIFPLFTFHASRAALSHFSESSCSVPTLMTRLVETGGLIAVFTNILVPFYIWIVFSVLRRHLPKIFTRIGIGIILSLLGVFSMLIIDGVGHSLFGNETEYNITASQCMFQIFKYNYTFEYNPLNMHWSVFITPSLFLGIGPLLITTATLEFISAQSPQSMKGLLVGVLFAIRGLVQLIGVIAIIPLSLTQPWPLGTPSVISCCFVYLLLILLIGLLGFSSFVFVAKKYKYRERDDITFYQRDVEEVYTRYLVQAPDTIVGDDSDENESDCTQSKVCIS